MEVKRVQEGSDNKAEQREHEAVGEQGCTSDEA